MQEILVRYENVLVMGATWIVVGLLYKLVPWFKTAPIGARFQPLMPVVLASGFVWIPGAMPAATGIGERIMLGIILGFSCGHMHKVLKQSGMGDDKRINGNAP